MIGKTLDHFRVLHGLVDGIVQTFNRSCSGTCLDHGTEPHAASATPHANLAATDAEVGWWPAGLDCASGTTAPIWLSGAERVELTDVYVERKEPWRHDWRRGAWLDSYNLRAVKQTRVTVV